MVRWLLGAHFRARARVPEWFGWAGMVPAGGGWGRVLCQMFERRACLPAYVRACVAIYVSAYPLHTALSTVECSTFWLLLLLPRRGLSASNYDTLMVGPANISPRYCPVIVRVSE